MKFKHGCKLLICVLSAAALAGCGTSDSADREEFIPPIVYLGVLEHSVSSDAGGSIGSRPDIRVFFDRPVNKDSASGKISLHPHTLLQSINFTVKLDASEDVLAFSPIEDLLPGDEYTVEISSGLCGASGVCLQKPYSFSFTVEQLSISSTEPAANFSQKEIDTPVVVNFDRAPLSAGLAGSFSFTRDSDSSPVVYDFSADNNGATVLLAPVTPLAPGEGYTVAVSAVCTEVRICMAGPFELKFSTAQTGWGDWTQIAQTTPAQTHAAAAAASFLDKIWILGGQTDTTGAVAVSDKVYSSNAAVTVWNPIAPTGTSWSARSGHAAAVFNNELWVVGGESSFFALKNDVWRTANGSAWQEATSDAAWAARHGHRLAEFNSELWLSGGSDNAVFLSDLYKSADGVSWTLVDATYDASFPGRSMHGFVSSGGFLWIFGGRGGGGSLNDVWRSADGIEWFRVTEHAAWTARHSFCGTAKDGNLYVIAGEAAGLTNQAYRSSGGAAWSLSSPQSALSARKEASCTLHKGEIYVAGGETANGSLVNDVWKMTGY